MSMNRDNFRANQPPSKVLHIRNLPPDATEHDVVELCKPFGRIVKTKVSTGNAKTQANQAFIEFENVNCAMRMIFSFVGSADPPKVRSKTVYLQYSTRQEIGSGNWGFGAERQEHTGNVILIILDNIHVTLGPNLDTIHMLCAAFGDVAKIAMFEKQNALQALVQFKDSRNAKEAQQTLNGTTIPDHMVPNHPGKITMKVSFSAHTDLQIHSQSERSRDFTVPYTPGAGAAAATAAAGAAAADHYTAISAAAAAGSEPHQVVAAASSSNVLQCDLEQVAYTPTIEALHTIFATYGFVQKLVISEKNHHWQALVQYYDDATASTAKQYLDGHAMYPGGKNKLKLSFYHQRDLQVRMNSDRHWDFMVAPGGPQAAAAAAEYTQAAQSAAAAAAAAATAGRGEAGGSSAQQGSLAGAAVPSSPRSPRSKHDHDPHAPITGQDWEHAHIEAARIAAEVLGEPATSQTGGGPRTMRPVNKPYAAAAGYVPPSAAYGYLPAAGYPPPGYGYPTSGYQYGY